MGEVPRDPGSHRAIIYGAAQRQCDLCGKLQDDDPNYLGWTTGYTEDNRTRLDICAACSMREEASDA